MVSAVGLGCRHQPAMESRSEVASNKTPWDGLNQTDGIARSHAPAGNASTNS